MHTKYTAEEGIAVLFVAGRIDHAFAAEFEAAAAQHAPDGASTAVIDLSGVDYISSAALKVIEALADRLSQAGGGLRLRAPSVAARLALEFSGLDRFVE